MGGSYDSVTSFERGRTTTLGQVACPLAEPQYVAELHTAIPEPSFRHLSAASWHMLSYQMIGQRIRLFPVERHRSGDELFVPR